MDERYAPPRSALEIERAEDLPRLSPGWGPMELLRVSVAVLQRDLGLWLSVGAFMVGVELVLGVVPWVLFPTLAGEPVDFTWQMLEGTGPYQTERTIFNYAVAPLLLLMKLGLVHMGLNAVRGQPLEFGQLFSGWRWLVPAIFSAIVLTIGTFLGICLLVVPGILFALGVSLGQQVMVDRDRGPVECLADSWDLTMGSKAVMALSYLVIGVLAMVGTVVTLGLGAVLLYPLNAVCRALIYDVLRRGQEL